MNLIRNMAIILILRPFISTQRVFQAWWSMLMNEPVFSALILVATSVWVALIIQVAQSR